MLGRLFAVCLLALVASACATPQGGGAKGLITVGILAINDFHGHIEPPRQSVDAFTPSGERLRVPVGGAAYLATAVDRTRAKYTNSLMVSAGDLIGGTPITSSLFLDEPAIGVMNRIGLDFNAVGNHEFDRGRAELLRMQYGGCAKHTVRVPCQVENPFSGAKFQFLAANVITEKGEPLLPATAIRRFGRGRQAISIGLIGLTLKDTPSLASPAGLVGLDFRDEAETINALVPKLKAQGANAVVVLIHQGLFTTVGPNDQSCGGISGQLLPILGKLDPQVDLVVSGHTHWAYICDYAKIDPARRFLVTSGGLWGQFLTDIALEFDPETRRVTARRATNVMVQSAAYTSTAGLVTVKPQFEAFAPRADVAAYVARYSEAVKVLRQRPVGKISASVQKPALATNESPLGNLIADAQLAATKAAGAEFALMNNTGIRGDITVPSDGSVTFGDLFTVQPFANELKTMTLTGEEMKALLEQQFDGESFDQAFSPSAGVAYAFDLSRPLGSRVFDILIGGKPLDSAASYRFTVNSFLAGGGDSFTVLRKGRDVVTGGQDLDALESWIAAVPLRTLPALGRVRNLTPAAKR